MAAVVVAIVTIVVEAIVGVVFLPAVESRGLGWLSSLPERIAAASVALHGELLELDDGEG